MKPLVSVVVATYRQDRRLIAALQSLSEQTYENFEVILVDDNDLVEWNDKILEIVNSFKNLKINYVQNKQNLGSAKTRNVGISNSKGRYITYLDDDDIYLPEKIAHQVEVMIKEDADFSITDLYLYNKNDKVIDKRVRNNILKTDHESLMEYHLKYHLTGTDSLMFKRDYLFQIGCFDEIDLGDEFYLMKKAIANGGKFIYVPGCHIKAYVHTGESGLSSGTSKIKAENSLYYFKKQYFESMDRKTVNYIKMRHYAVLAFAFFRMKKPLHVLKYGFLSFVTSPKDCIILLIERKTKN